MRFSQQYLEYSRKDQKVFIAVEETCFYYHDLKLKKEVKEQCYPLFRLRSKLGCRIGQENRLLQSIAREVCLLAIAGQLPQSAQTSNCIFLNYSSFTSKILPTKLISLCAITITKAFSQRVVQPLPFRYFEKHQDTELSVVKL